MGKVSVEGKSPAAKSEAHVDVTGLRSQPDYDIIHLAINDLNELS